LFVFPAIDADVIVGNVVLSPTWANGAAFSSNGLFPNLKQIIGNLVVQSTSATSITFATLEHVVGHVHFKTNSVMTTLDFPQLKTIQGSGSYFYLHQNGYLNSLLVPNLEWVEGWIEIRENNAMWTINFPALISTGPDILVDDLQTGKIIDTFLFDFKLTILNESFLSHHFANISS